MITKSAAVSKVADLAYPNEPKRDAEKRVRSRISYAQKKGDLPRGERFSDEIFWDWALENKGWSALAQHRGSSIPLSVKVGSMTIKTQLNSVSVVQMPTDPDLLGKAFQELTIKVQQANKRIAELEDELNRTALELEAFRSKDFEKRAKCSRAGKKGGRGNAC